MYLKERYSEIKGFTFVELSMVLVIISLATSGVLFGASLLESAKVRKLNSQFKEIELAVKVFQLKYGYLPGDLNNAEAFWGTETVSGGSGTIDGDGEGDYITGTSTQQAFSEGYRAWEHLSLAGLYKGSYLGTGVGGNQASIGTTVPTSVFDGMGFSFQTRTDNSSMGVSDNTGTWLWNGAEVNNHITWGGLYTPLFVSIFDIKFDDGVASNGLIRATTNYGTTVYQCTSGGSPNFIYHSSTSGRCPIVYFMIQGRLFN